MGIMEICAVASAVFVRREPVGRRPLRSRDPVRRLRSRITARFGDACDVGRRLRGQGRVQWFALNDDDRLFKWE